MPDSRRLRPLAALTGAILIVAFLGFHARAAQGDPGQDIASGAMRYVDTYQGDCWPWVRRVVEQAIGRTIGFGYRDGFLEAGAVEVVLANAAPGDIIQIADDRDTSPSADYPGLHTAIVLQNHGGGVFTVIDSNSNWDGMVRVRPGYDPIAMAARYPGLSVRVYRFGAAGLLAGTAPAAPALAAPRPLSAGDTVRVAAGGDCLNLRAAAGTQGGVVTCLADGTRLTVLAPPVEVGSLEWAQVATAGGQTGWVATAYLQVLPPGASAPATSAGPLSPLKAFRSVVPNVTASR